MSCSVYVIGHEHGTFGHAVKVGIAGNAASRLRELQTANADELTLYFAFRFEDRETAREVERLFHQSELAGPLRGEWVGCNPDEVLLYLTFIIAAVIRKSFPPDQVANARRACGLLDAFAITDTVSPEVQEMVNDRWSIVQEIMQ